MQAQAPESGYDRDALTEHLIDLREPGDAAARTVLVSANLASALRRARWVSEGKHRFDVSFGSLLIGLTTGSDSVGRWLEGRFAVTPKGLTALLLRSKVDTDDFERLRLGGAGERGEPRSFSTSARGALEAAQQRAVADSPVGTADVLHSMLTLPGYHVEDFRSMGIDRDAWARAFESVEPSLEVSEQPLKKIATIATPAGPIFDVNLGSDAFVGHVEQALRLGMVCKLGEVGA